MNYIASFLVCFLIFIVLWAISFTCKIIKNRNNSMREENFSTSEILASYAMLLLPIALASFIVIEVIFPLIQHFMGC